MKKIALVAGGYTGEHAISLLSAATIAKHLNREKYSVFTIIIDKDHWQYTDESGAKILVDKNDFSLTIESVTIKFDAAFIAIHGTPGEDGCLQGYFDMLGIKYTTCNPITSALTFNKGFCNKVVKDLNVVGIANSVVLIKGVGYSLGNILDKIKLPVFVKPNESGSSLGTSKVKTVNELMPAIEKAFSEDEQVIIEEFIEGRELTIGAYKLNGVVHVLPPTEIVSQNEFFDYEAKYKGESEEITPAQLSDDELAILQQKVKYLYEALNCRGIVRADFILKETGEYFFLEVNTMPGQSEASLIPQQVRASGQNLTDFYGDLLEECLQYH